MPSSAAARSHWGRSGPSPIRRSRACGQAAWTRANTRSRSRWFFTASKRAMQATTRPGPACGRATRAKRCTSMPLPIRCARTPRQRRTRRRSSRFCMSSRSVRPASARSVASEYSFEGSRERWWKWNPWTVWTTSGTPAARAATRPRAPGTELCVWTRCGSRSRKKRVRRQAPRARAMGSSPRGVSMTATGTPAARRWSTSSPALHTIQFSIAGGRWRGRTRSRRISLAEAAVLITSTMRSTGGIGFVKGRLKSGGGSVAVGSYARAVSTGPPVQREHGPEFLRTIGPSARMLAVERLDGVPTHAGQEATSGVDDVPEEAPELGPEPLAHRRLEASLAPATDLRREHVAERPAQDALAAQGADLPAPRDAERALDEPMIEERHSDLEGVGHARDVDLGEHVPGEPEPAVRVQHAVDRVPVVHGLEPLGLGGEQLAHGGRGCQVRDQRTDLGFAAHLRPARVAPSDVGDAAAVRHPSQLADGFLEAVAAPRRSERGDLGEQPDERPRRPGRVGFAQVLRVAAEQLVRPVPGEDHLHVPARLARDLEAGQERGVGERLVEIVEGWLQRREHLRTGQGILRVDAAHLSRHRTAEPCLVEDRVLVEGHGEGAQRGGAGRRGQAADHRGIDAAAQEGAHRHVRHQVLAYGGREEGAELLLRGRFRAVRDPRLAVPVRASPHALALEDEQLSGGEAVHVLVDGGGAGDVATAQVVVQRPGVDLAFGQPRGGERLDLRGEAEAPRPARVEERLDPEAVPGEDEPPGRAVPDRECEHAVQPRDAVGPVVLVDVDDRLAVARGLEAMTARLELRAERAIIVDLAVAHDPHRAGLVHQRLRAAGHVDDGQPAVSERRLAVDPVSLAVRPALDEGARHAAHPLAGVDTTVKADQACDSTHGTTP